MDALSEIWNEDGTPKRPEPDQGTEHAFADLGINNGTNGELYLSYAKAREEAMKNTPATVGDIVHFWSGEKCRAALVIESDHILAPERKWLLRVFVPGFGSEDVATSHDEGKKTGTWHWAESA